MAEVFVSYRHVKPDEDLAAELATYLTQRGVAYFVDTKLQIGQKWVEVIDREIRDCHSLVVLLSADSVRSDMVREEVKLAHEMNKRIFPVRVGYDGALPYDLGSYLNPIQYRLWTPGQPFLPVCQAIVEGIRGVASQDGAEPSPEALRRLNEATELRGAPLPSADPRLETGALKLDSPFYVRRGGDRQAADLATQPGETILIKGPRQVGKTSLAARVLAHAQSHGQATCYIDFQSLEDSRFASAATLLRYLAARLAREFRSPIKPADVWDDLLGDADSLTEFLEQGMLETAAAPVVLCLDEVDSLFKYPYRDSFFGMLRSWHNRRATHSVWNRFNLILVHSTEPALFIRDVNQSPFNIGHPFRLGDFDRDEILWLNQRHGGLLPAAEVDLLIRLVGGHPYLVRQSLYVLATTRMGMSRLEQIAPGDQGPFGDHLRRILWVLRDNPPLRKTLRQAVISGACDDEDNFQRLRAAGLIEGESRQAARPRCELYSVYLRSHL